MLRAAGATGLALALPALSACTGSTPEPQLVIAGGVAPGVYLSLAQTLAEVWAERLELDPAPRVLSTAGSGQNMQMLTSGTVQVAISQIDVAETFANRTDASSPFAPRALARLYDDATHVVVRRDSPITRFADLRGARVSIGPSGSGYQPIAIRLLDVAGIGVAGLGTRAELGLADAATALREGRIDAFFWSGGVPTDGIRALAQQLPVRLLDLTDVLPRLRERFPVYSVGTVPADTYGLPAPISTLTVRNALLVTVAMGADEARTLIAEAFEAQPRLAAASPAAVTIDSRSAIGTQPIPLHPGAEEFYRSTKGY